MPRKNDLSVYKEAFQWAINELGLKSYEVYFDRDTKLAAWAETTIDTEGRNISTTLGPAPAKDCGSYPNRQEAIRATAIHEALHALLAQLSDLAHDRYATQDQLDLEEEAIVVALTRVLYELLRARSSL